ncbi:MAG: ATP synthase subunit I [Burkholderiaceae bacterium]
MKTIVDTQPNDADDADIFKPLSAEEARQLRERHPPVSPWRVVAGQAIVGLVLAVGLAGFSGRSEWGWSALWGVLAVVVPAALFARGIRSRVSTVNPGAAVFGFLLWEMGKIALTVAMLFAAPRVVEPLSWPAMLAGLVVTMKVYWVALLWRPAGKRVESSVKHGV